MGQIGLSRGTWDGTFDLDIMDSNGNRQKRLDNSAYDENIQSWEMQVPTE